MVDDVGLLMTFRQRREAEPRYIMAHFNEQLLIVGGNEPDYDFLTIPATMDLTEPEEPLALDDTTTSPVSHISPGLTYEEASRL